ncbi:MAG: hypothetical protein ACKVU2_15230 [Saprospiraceae bacterium]
MNTFQKGLRIALFIAAGCLVLNDAAVTAFPCLQQLVFALVNDQECEEESIPSPNSNLLEEQAKHHESNHWIDYTGDLSEETDPSAAHLIQDDDVSVFAFITIFSPPPELA